MSLPTYSLQCPSARGLTLRYSQQIWWKNCRVAGMGAAMLLGSQRSGVVKVMAMGRKKLQDMELEIGGLLGFRMLECDCQSWLRETLESLDTRLTSDDLNDLRETAINVTDENEKIVMPELIGVTKRLEAYKGIDRVQIGRRIQGAELSPTFQVYLSGQLDDGFKLLARYGNQEQEVLVKRVLDRESMKDAIRHCTFSDE